MAPFNNFLKTLNRLSFIFIGFCFVFALGCAVYFIFSKTPSFLFDIKNSALENEALMDSIGGEAGYDLYYSGDKLPQKIFHVKVNGQCPEASLIINGVYSAKSYTITDTVFTKCH